MVKTNNYIPVDNKNILLLNSNLKVPSPKQKYAKNKMNEKNRLLLGGFVNFYVFYHHIAIFRL